MSLSRRTQLILGIVHATGLVLFFLALWLIFWYLGSIPDFTLASRKNSPRDFFAEIVERPVPDDVKNLQGTQSADGKSIWLRFEASGDYLANLKKRCQAVNCDATENPWSQRPPVGVFEPEWQVEMTSAQCFLIFGSKIKCYVRISEEPRIAQLFCQKQ